MKKDNFIRGAFIATICIVISKILGIIYVIPFHAIIDADGRTLYGYAYNIYQMALTLSTVGLPVAISKIVSEYNTLGLHDLKRRSYKLAFIIMVSVSILASVLLFIFAPNIADAILGGVIGGNTRDEIAFVIRASTTAITLVTILSSMRGYLQGHKYISYSSIGDVIEQFARVVIIILGSYVAVQLFDVTTAVGVAVFGATIGALAACLYLFPKVKRIKKDDDYDIKEEEKNVSNGFLIKKVLTYAFPFIIVGIAVSLFNTIDMLMVVPLYVEHGNLAISDAETILSIITTWGAKLNVIVTSLAAGLVVSVLPNITSDYVAKRFKALHNKINTTLQIIIFIVLPMIIGMSLLAQPVWTIFYDNNPLGPQVFMFSIMTALFYSLFLNVNAIMQAVGKIKISNIAIVSGVLIKFLLNVPLIWLMGMLSLPVYLGSIFATILGYGTFLVISFITLKKHINIEYKDTLKVLGISILSTIVMVGVMLSLNYIWPISETNVVLAIVKVAVYTVLGACTYFIISSHFKTFDKIFGMSVKELIFNKILRKKK